MRAGTARSVPDRTHGARRSIADRVQTGHTGSVGAYSMQRTGYNLVQSGTIWSGTIWVVPGTIWVVKGDPST
eukprot:19681-Rhodomonas_salina.2